MGGLNDRIICFILWISNFRMDNIQMTKLRTLKDFKESKEDEAPYTGEYSIGVNEVLNKVKNEAIKWVKEIEYKWDKMRDEPQAFAMWVIWFIQYVHNITEEDLTQ